MDEEWESEGGPPGRSHGGPRSRDDAVYGVFLDGGSAEGAGLGAGSRGSGKGGKKKAEQGPVTFVAGGVHKSVDEGEHEDAGSTLQTAASKGRGITIVLPQRMRREQQQQAGDAEAQYPPDQPPRVSSKRRGTLQTPSFLGANPVANWVMRRMVKEGWEGAGDSLGIRGGGVDEAIEVVTRPGRLGLGGMSEKTAQQQRWDRQMARRRGELPSDEESDDEPGTNIFAAAAAASREAPRDGRPGRRGKWRKTQHESESAAVELPHAEKIIDMRGAQARVLSGMHEIFATLDSTQQHMASRGMLAELRFNTRRLTELSGAEVKTLQSSLETESAKLTSLQQRRSSFDEAESARSEQADALERVIDALDACKRKIDGVSAEDFGMNEEGVVVQPPINLASLARVMFQLHKQNLEAWSLFELHEPVLCLATTLLKKTLQGWDALSHPSLGTQQVAAWHDLLAHSCVGGGSGRILYERLVRSAIIPRLRTALSMYCLAWQTRNCGPAVALVEDWGPLVRDHLKEQLMRDTVLPRLLHEVDNWNPRTESAESLERFEICKSVRSKLGIWLGDRSHEGDNCGRVGGDEAFFVVGALVDVFSAGGMRELLNGKVFPRLRELLKKVRFDPTPGDQDYSLWLVVRRWAPLSAELFAKMVLEDFFPRFHCVLLMFLSSGASNAKEAFMWYEQWKRMFLPQSEASSVWDELAEVFGGQWAKAVDIITEALESGESQRTKAMSVEDMNNRAVEEIEERAVRVLAARRPAARPQAHRPAAYAATDDLSFKDMVLKYAESCDLQFTPKIGRMHDGKQLYHFGRVLCYLDKGCIYGQLGGRWQPVTLENVERLAKV